MQHPTLPSMVGKWSGDARKKITLLPQADWLRYPVSDWIRIQF